MEPQHLIGQPMYADNHCGRYVGLLEQPAPLRDSLTVTGEDDCFGPVRGNVHRDLPPTVALERLGDKLSRDYAGAPSDSFSLRLTRLRTCFLMALPSYSAERVTLPGCGSDYAW